MSVSLVARHFTDYFEGASKGFLVAGFCSIGEIDCCNMKFSTALQLVFLYVLASEAVAKFSTVSPTLSYWHHKLPTTPIPYALQELISPLSSSELLADLKENDSPVINTNYLQLFLYSPREFPSDRLSSSRAFF